MRNSQWLIAIALLSSAGAQAARSDKPGPLTIQEQGSFAVGGKVTANPGTFNPKQPTPQGQTLHGDHAYVFYQIPANRRKLPLVFLHGTGQFSRLGRPLRMAGRVFRRSFSAADFPYISSISRVVATRAAVPSQRPSTPYRMSRRGSIPSGSAFGRTIFPASSFRKIQKH
jgi:hypothetical protein